MESRETSGSRVKIQLCTPCLGFWLTSAFLLSLAFMWRQVCVNKKNSRNSSFSVSLLLLSAVAYFVCSLSPVVKERQVAAEELSQVWIWADQSAYRATFMHELKHLGGVGGQAQLSTPSSIASTSEEH